MRIIKKLAIALGSVMAFVALQAPTMAASNAVIDTPSIIIGSTLGYRLDSNGNIIQQSANDALNVYVQTTVAYKEEQFLIKGTNVLFDETVYNNAPTTTSSSLELVEVERLSNDTLRVSVSNIDDDKMFTIPVYMEITGANPTLEIIGNGGISSQTINVSNETLSDKNVKIEFGTTRNIPIEGNGMLGEIIIDEVIVGALNQETDVIINLETNSGLVFDLKVGDQIQLSGTQGFVGIDAVATITKITANDQQITLTLPALDDNKIKGAIKIANLPVKAENRKVGVICDRVSVKVEVNNAVATGVVSDVTEYEVYLDSRKIIELIAGGASQKVEFTINETVAGSLNDNLDIFFMVKGANIINFEEKIIDGIHFSANTDRYGNITEIVAEMTDDFNKKIANNVTLELELISGVNETGIAEVIAESRGFNQNLELAIGDIKNTLNIDAVSTTVLTGLQGQVGGQIVIQETEANILEKHEQIVVEFVNANRNGIRLEDATLTGTNGLEFEYEIEGDFIIIDITRESARAGEIIVSDINLTVGQNAPIGKFDVQIGGTAISRVNTKETAMNDVLTIKEFILTEKMYTAVQEATPVTEIPVLQDILEVETINTQEEIIAVDEITTIVLSDIENLLTTPYISSHNNLMIGVRDVVTIFGLDDNSIRFENGKTQILSDNIKIEIEQGSNIININGINIIMEDIVEVVDGRTCVSAKYIALALGLDINITNDTIEFTTN